MLFPDPLALIRTRSHRMSPEDRVENVTADEPMRTTGEEPLSSVQTTSTSDERMWGMLCHLSALVASAVTGMGFLGPLICWLVKKDTSRFVDDQGKEALNFQINMLIYIVIAVGVAFATCGIGAVLLIPIGLYAFIMPIIAGIKANSGELYRYPLTFRIL
jgi:uncharacterized Tic20 family protein